MHVCMAAGHARNREARLRRVMRRRFPGTLAGQSLRTSDREAEARLREVYSAAATAAAINPVCVTFHRGLLSPEQYSYYSVWYYSVNRSRIGPAMQQHRRRRAKSTSAEDRFGQVLRELRTARGLTQEDLAFQSGYHSGYISLLERGNKSPSLRTIMNLATVLKTPASEILQRVEALDTKTR